MPDITHEQYFYFLNYFTAVFSQQCDDGKGYCSSDMATVTMSSKHQPLNIYLVFLLFSYISSGNHFHASGAINNNEYCSITKQHTMCSPEVIYSFLSTFHIIHIILLIFLLWQNLVLIFLCSYRAMAPNVVPQKDCLEVLVKMKWERSFVSIINGAQKLLTGK